MNDIPQQEPYPPQYPYPAQPHYGSPAYGPPTTYGYKNGLATAALVTGITGASLFMVPFVAWILGGLAFIFGLVGIAKVRRGTSDAKGRAIAGIVIGAIALVLGTFMFAAYYQAASDINDYDNCTDRTRLANWDRCEKYLD